MRKTWSAPSPNHVSVVADNTKSTSTYAMRIAPSARFSHGACIGLSNAPGGSSAVIGARIKA